MSRAIHIQSQVELASKLGISLPALRRHIYRDDFPQSPKAPWNGWQLRSIRNYIEAFQSTRATPTDEKPSGPLPRRAEIEIKYKMERMRKVKLEREILEQSYVSRADVEQQWTERARYLRRSLENLGAEISTTLAGLDAADIQEVIDSRIGEILDGYIVGS